MGNFLDFFYYKQMKLHENEAMQYFRDQKCYGTRQAHFGKISFKSKNLKKFDDYIDCTEKIRSR